MMTNQEEEFNYEKEISEIRISMEQAETMVKDGAMVERLLKQRDFKRVIVDGYFNEEARRLVLALGEPNMQAPAVQERLLRDIKAISSLRQYLDLIMANGLNMQEEILKSQQEIGNLHAAQAAEQE